MRKRAVTNGGHFCCHASKNQYQYHSDEIFLDARSGRHVSSSSAAMAVSSAVPSATGSSLSPFFLPFFSRCLQSARARVSA